MAYKAQVNVDGRDYEFYHISVRKLNRLAVKIGKILLPILSDLVGKDVANVTNIQSNILDKDLDLESLFTKAAEVADEEKIEQIVNSLLSECICVGVGKLSDPAKFERAFESNPFGVFKVTKEAFNVYFKDYFSAGRENVASSPQ